MKTAQILNEIKKLLSAQNKTKIIVIAGLLGIGLIMLSEFLPDNNTDQNIKDTSDSVISDNTDTYKQEIESELKNIIGKINGVGDLEVMVTIEGTTEYVYAEELDTDNDKDGEKTSEKYTGKSTGKNLYRDNASPGGSEAVPESLPGGRRKDCRDE